MRPQCRQPGANRLPHRAKSQQQDRAAPQGAFALGQQNADAPLRRGDGVADGQLLPGKVIHQLHPGFRCNDLCFFREHPAQRQRPGACRPQQLRQRGAGRVQRQRQQDIVCQRDLFRPLHRIPRPGQRPACRQLPGIAADHRKAFLSFHPKALLPKACAILCTGGEEGDGRKQKAPERGRKAYSGANVLFYEG